MRILAIESSCDETAAAIIEDGRKILSSVINTQVAEHGLYGGVVPEIASRRHAENIVAVALFRKYGNDCDNERVFFYNQNVEVDFYIPEEELAIQVSYSIDKSDVTLNREVDALLGLADQLLDVLSDDGLSCLSLRMLIV